MGGRPKPTYEEVKELFEGKNYILLESEYIDSKTKMKYICKKHPEHTQSIRYTNIKSGVGCKYCGHEKAISAQKLDYEFVRNEFKKRGYKLLDKVYFTNATPMRYECPHHPDKETKMTYTSLKRGSSCPYCSNTAKHTIEEVIEDFASVGYKVLDEIYKDNKTPIRYICSHHPDKNLKITYKEFKKGARCPYCSNVGRASYEEVKKDFENAGYMLLENEYINSKTPMKCKCVYHEDIIQYKTYQTIKQGRIGCKYCLGIAKHTYQEVKKNFESRGYILISKKYVNLKTKLKYICPKHNDTTKEILYRSFLAGSGCNECGIERTKLSFDYVKSVFEDKGYRLLEKEYVNNQTKMKYICPSHPDEEKLITFNSLQQGIGCFECYLDKYSRENHPNWNPNLTDEERQDKRKYKEYSQWVQSVYERDKYTCQCCGEKTKYLNAHHKDGYHWCKERRTDINNGITLCVDCHKEFHNTYGTRNNTEEQFIEWIMSKETT